MQLSRMTTEYIDFLLMRTRVKILRPYRKWNNFCWKTRDLIEEHLIRERFKDNYECLTFYRKTLSSSYFETTKYKFQLLIWIRRWNIWNVDWQYLLFKYRWLRWRYYSSRWRENDSRCTKLLLLAKRCWQELYLNLKIFIKASCIIRLFQLQVLNKCERVGGSYLVCLIFVI